MVVVVFFFVVVVVEEREVGEGKKKKKVGKKKTIEKMEGKKLFFSPASLSSLSLSDATSRVTGMPVHFETISAMSDSVTTS